MGVDAGVAEGTVFVTAEGEDGLVHLLGVEHPQPHEEVEVLDGQSCDRAEQIGLQLGDDVLKRVLAEVGEVHERRDPGGELDQLLLDLLPLGLVLLLLVGEFLLLLRRQVVALGLVLEFFDLLALVDHGLGDNIIETIINKSEKVKELKNKAKDDDLTAKEKKELTDEEKEYKSKRKLVQEKLIKFATRIPAFMYLTDFRENTLQDVITKLEPDLFLAVTGLTVKDFHLLVRLKVFNTEQMNQAVFAFRRYEDASLRYTGIESHEGLTHYGLYDTVVARDHAEAA